MDITPRNTFNCRLAGRYWQIPTGIPQATHLNVPIGTHFCDHLGFLCHPQQYRTFHGGEFDGHYKDVNQESKLQNLDYYNPRDSYLCDPKTVDYSPNRFIEQKRVCQTTPRVFRNTTKLWKYNQF